MMEIQIGPALKDALQEAHLCCTWFTSRFNKETDNQKLAEGLDKLLKKLRPLFHMIDPTNQSEGVISIAQSVCRAPDCEMAKFGPHEKQLFLTSRCRLGVYTALNADGARELVRDMHVKVPLGMEVDPHVPAYVIRFVSPMEVVRMGVPVCDAIVALDKFLDQLAMEGFGSSVAVPPQAQA